MFYTWQEKQEASLSINILKRNSKSKIQATAQVTHFRCEGRAVYCKEARRY